MLWNRRGRKIRFEIPHVLVVQKAPSTLKAIVAGFELGYREEIEAWFAEQKINHFGIRGTAIMGQVVLGPFTAMMREHDAVLFKMRWM